MAPRSLSDYLVRSHRRVVFFTAAGMSAESGVPTYRGKGGIWKEYDYETCACQQAVERDPARSWDFHNYRRKLVAARRPNRGHQLIADAEAARPGTTVVTQNIDGLHQLAGSRNVHELHGSLWQVRCDACGARREYREAPPVQMHCPYGLWWRPDIVWFGDSLPGEVIESAMQATEHCDLLISSGTSALVYPAAQMPRYARKAGAKLVEVNPEPTPMSAAYDLVMHDKASECLARLCEGT